MTLEYIELFNCRERMPSYKFSYPLVIFLCIFVLLYIKSYYQNADLRMQYETLRKDYGALSCKCNGVGPTGGFCLNKDKTHVGGNNLWCNNIANELRRLFNGQSVYDFGAGLGWYGKALITRGTDGYRVSDYEAFDGAENIESIFPDGFVKYLDLSQPVYLPAKDWVLSFEVGEHIPAKHEQTFIENLHRHNKKGIVLSWALEGKVIYSDDKFSRIMTSPRVSAVERYPIITRFYPPIERNVIFSFY